MPTLPTSVVKLPTGQLAANPDAFRQAWNKAAPSQPGVATISSFTQQPLAGHTAFVADLGGNLRLVLASDGPSSPVAAAVLAWLPLDDASQQPTQNAAYRDAFAVLIATVDATVTNAQQTQVASQLGLDDRNPPFRDGASADASLEQQRYELRALTPSGRSGIYTLVGVAEPT